MAMKVSAMLLDIAGEYIRLGEDTEHRRQLLSGAVSAWNMACLAPKQSRAALKMFMSEYKEMNPSQTQRDYQNVEEDMRLLMKRKREIYPDEVVQIIGARLEESDGQMYVETMTVRIQK